MTRFPGLVIALSWCAALATAVVGAPERPALGAVAIGLAAPCLALAVILRPPVIALALTAALLAVGRAELPAADPQAPTRAAALAGQTVSLTGHVADDPRPSGGGVEVLVEPDGIAAPAGPVAGIGSLMVRWRGPTEVAFGDEVQASGKLALPKDLPTFDRRAYLAQRHVYLEVQATSLDVVATGSGIAGLPAWLRHRYTVALDHAVSPPHAAVLLGIVLGIRQGIPSGLQQALIATGLIHLLVLSGLKVAVFARIIQGALNPLLGRLATWPALALIALYAMVGGATPAATRAAAMGGLAIAASHLGRPTHVWTALAVTAAVMLGWHPELAWDVGFQLSFAGTAAIILLTPGISRRLRFMPHFLREPFAVTCAAQVGTLPMMASDFHVLSPAAPFANALTLPILPVLVTLGLLLGPLSLLPDLARYAAIPITGLLAYVEQVAYLLARAPSAAISIPTFPAWAGAAYYAALGGGIAGTQTKGRHRKVALVAAVAAPAVISTAALVMWAQAPPQASVLAVGDGQAVLLRGPLGAILIDGGPSPQKLSDELGTHLPPWQSRIDALVITAPGLGHVGGLAGFDRQLTSVYFPDADMSGATWRTAALEAAARGASIQRLRAGETVTVAGFELQVLSPEQGAPGDVPGAADMALRVVSPDGASLCDFSDLDLDGQTIAAARVPGSCTYVLLPSGGRSLLSPDLDRVAITASTQLIASRGPGRLATGFPPNLLRTDQEGTIVLAM
ncbi:MAG TPA: ComEC/Rec2 family competence protein [Candidatus Dormibacteraeota bacterium]|nr:ComEC/Rec2 family competence protein [Candidatus Dormibacteraeota bacterium]